MFYKSSSENYISSFSAIYESRYSDLNCSITYLHMMALEDGLRNFTNDFFFLSNEENVKS